MILVVVFLFIALTQMSTFLFAPNPEKDAWGKILSPAAGSVNSNEFVVVGETQDIASGQFIWIVLQKPGSAFCLPEKRVLRNTRFRATLPTGRLKGTYTLSLYVLDETVHHLWEEHLKQEMETGLPQPLDNRKLDQVRITLSAAY